MFLKWDQTLFSCRSNQTLEFDEICQQPGEANMRVKSTFLLTLLICGLSAAGWLYFRFWRSHRYDASIAEASRRYKMPPGLIKAVIWRESNFKEKAVGTVGELGLMQVQETAAREWVDAERIPIFSEKHLLNPHTNIFAGTFYLSKLVHRYKSVDNPLPYGLADYNAGRQNVLRWAKGAAKTNSAAFFAAIDFPTTRRYISSILERQNEYASDFKGP